MGQMDKKSEIESEREIIKMQMMGHNAGPAFVVPTRTRAQV
jgi:hypothetical protein